VTARFHLVPHPTGPWILTVGRRHFVIAPELGRKLARPESARHLTPAEDAALAEILAGDRDSDGAEAGARRSVQPAGAGRVIWPRVPLLPAELVDSLARRLGGLATGAALLAQAAGGLAAFALGFRLPADEVAVPALSPASVAVALPLFLATALWHELGHAAALRRHGYPAGGIGLGLLFVIPVMFCDVTAVAALPRRERLRVNLAGVAFQQAAAGLVFLAGGVVAGEAGAGLRLAALSGLLAIGWSLLPFVRTDGYWLLCDLLGRHDLESPLEPGGDPTAGGRLLSGGRSGAAAGGRHRQLLAAFLVLYRLANGLFLLLVCAWLPVRLIRWLPLDDWLAGREYWQRPMALLLGLLLLGLFGRIWLSVGRRLGGMMRAVGLDLRFIRAD